MNEILDRVEFVGFEPDEGTRAAIGRTLDMIMGSAPSDCYPMARIEKKQGGFDTFLCLHSQQGTFEAHGVAPTPEEAMLRLTERIYEQIRSWRTHRNLPDSESTVNAIA